MAMVLSMLLAQAAAAMLMCEPIPGADAILDDRSRRYIVMGEIHGTVEAPAMFADLVCEASNRGPVIVGIEFPATEQALFDEFLASDGGEAARSRLLDAGQWRAHDGRSSVAMLDLLDRLRRLKQAGRIAAVVAFVPAPSPGAAQTDYERRMAANWSAALDRNPDARLFALVGNIHAMQQGLKLPDGTELRPAATFLPAEQRVTLNLAEVGGAAYNVQGGKPGEHSLGNGSGAVPRSIAPIDGGNASAEPYGFRYSPGRPFSASPPAKLR